MFVGSILLALLFVAGWHLPQFPAEPARADVDAGIRFHARHK
jgi:hypothetical protein